MGEVKGRAAEVLLICWESGDRLLCFRFGASALVLDRLRDLFTLAVPMIYN